LDVPKTELGALTQAKLGLDILRVIKQHTACCILVTPRPPSLLKVVLQRTWDVRVNYQADIRLVDAHAKRIGGDNDAKPPCFEVLLDVLLFIGLKPSVEMTTQPPLPDQKL